MSQLNPSHEQANTYAAAWIKKDHMQEAFDAAFPDSTANKQSRMEKASRLHKHPKIKEAIKKLQAAAQRSAERKIGFTVDKLKEKLVKAINLGLKLKKDIHGNKVPHSISGAVSAISEYNRMEGNHADQEFGFKGVITQVNMTAEEYKKARQEAIEADDC